MSLIRRLIPLWVFFSSSAGTFADDSQDWIGKWVIPIKPDVEIRQSAQGTNEVPPVREWLKACVVKVDGDELCVRA